MSACGEALDVTNVDVIIGVEGAAPAPFGVLSEIRQDCGLPADGALRVCEGRYATNVGQVRLHNAGNGSFPSADAVTARGPARDEPFAERQVVSPASLQANLAERAEGERLAEAGRAG